MDEMNDHEIHRQIDREVSNQGELVALVICVALIATIVAVGGVLVFRLFA